MFSVLLSVAGLIAAGALVVFKLVNPKSRAALADSTDHISK